MKNKNIIYGYVDINSAFSLFKDQECYRYSLKLKHMDFQNKFCPK